MGVILTGMGNDGALGMRAIYEGSGRTIGQDESTCAIFGMPKACAESGVWLRLVPLDSIVEQILLAAGYHRRASATATS